MRWLPFDVQIGRMVAWVYPRVWLNVVHFPTWLRYRILSR